MLRQSYAKPQPASLAAGSEFVMLVAQDLVI